MKTLIIVFLEILVSCCSPIHKCNSNDSMEQTIKERQVHNFEEISAELLNYLDKMGLYTSPDLSLSNLVRL